MIRNNANNSSTIFIVNDSPFLVKNGITAANNSLIRSFNQFPLNIFVVSENSFYFFDNGNLTKLDFVDYNVEDFNNIIYGSINLYQAHGNEKTVCVQLSDCYTHALFVNVKLSMKCGWFDYKSLLKIPFFYFKEWRICKSASYVLMQTERDVIILRNWRISSKGVSIPNVPKGQFIQKSKHVCTTQSIGWCASFEGTYLKIAKCFFKEILLDFLKKDHNINLNVLGSKSKEFVSWVLSIDNSLKNVVNAFEYQEDLTHFYRSNKVNISPVFKNYGLINKTVEAMASKTTVLGDLAAFNGVKAIHQHSCLIANKNSDWHKLLDLALFKMTQEEHLELGENASRLIYSTLTISKNNLILKNILQL